MPAQDAIEFMMAYAKRGVRYWESAVKDATKTRALRLLQNQVATNDDEVKVIINSVRSGAKRVLYVPMPKAHRADIELCLFLPVRVDDNKTSFELLMLLESDERCLAFRFEPADPGDTTHGYGHIQMNRRMEGGVRDVAGLPGWVPKSYPAFPLRTSEPIEMFLSMVTSIHGYRKGIVDLLDEVIPDPGPRKKYVEMLKRAML